MFRGSKPKSSLQLGPLDCGPANLRALCLNAGVRVDNDRMRSLCDTTRAGSSLFRLHDAAEALGFNARLRSLDLYDLRDHASTYLPVIVALNTGGSLHHFVTIHGFRGDRVIVIDPAFGVREVPFEEMRASIVGTELPYKIEDIRSEENSQDNQAELLDKLTAYSIPRSVADGWIERHSLFFIDDCLKYVEVLGARPHGRSLGAPANVLTALLEHETLELPEQFGTVIRYGESKSTALVTGAVVLEVKGKPHAEFASQETRGPRRRLFAHLWNYRAAWGPQAVLASCLAVLGLALASATGLMVESLDTGWPPFVVLLVALGGAQAVSDYARYANTRSVSRLTNALTLRAKAGMLDRLSLAPEQKLRDRSTGEMVARIEESAGLASFIAEWGVGTAVAIGTSLVAIGLIARSFWPFLAVAALQILVSGLIVELFSRRARRLARDVYEQSARYNARLLEILRGLEIVRLVRAGNYTFYDADRLSARMTRSTFAQQDWLILQQLVLSLGGVITTACMVFAAYFALSSGTATPAVITSAFALTATLQGSISALVRRRQLLESTGVVIDRFEELTAAPEGLAPSTRRNPADWERVELHGVTFGYRRDRHILQGLNLSFGRGEVICVLGQSGTGKSTLFDVITGVYEPEAGHVSADGDVLSRSDLRRMGTYAVHQEPGLIHGTLLENIVFGGSVPDPELLASAVAAAGLSDVIERAPDGFDTHLGGRWSSLSGGEKRRLCLCRALIRRPSLLLLDETLGALEPALRRTIVGRIRALDPRMTIIMITHDPMDAEFCTRAVVMSRGTIVEDGPPARLLADHDSHVRRLARDGSGHP
jgi:ABC-type bacteriocin/lantibiotic exporter with double-glycine peptidase domain